MSRPEPIFSSEDSIRLPIQALLEVGVSFERQCPGSEGPLREEAVGHCQSKILNT